VVLSGGDVEVVEELVAASGALCYLPKAGFGPLSLIRAWAAAAGGPGAPAP
jgi:hypothetical protein